MTVNSSSISVIESISIILAAGAFVISFIAFLRSQAAARAQTFLEFRKRFLEIKTQLPEWFIKKSKNDCPKYSSGSMDWRPIGRYWQNAFDEWLITTKIDKRVLGRLWRLFYRDAIRSGLTHTPLRYAVSQLTHGESEFGNYRLEFRKELDELWRELKGKGYKSICDGFECEHCSKGGS